MRADRLQTNTYPISHRPARAALCLLLGAGILALAVYLQLGRGGSLPFSLGSPATAVPSRATPSPKRAEGEITLAAHTWYALQLGAFTQEGSARQAMCSSRIAPIACWPPPIPPAPRRRPCKRG